MDVAGTIPESINCHSCGTRLELAGQTAFTHVECPKCGALSVVPLQFGNFLLLTTLGIGGMGTVYKAMDMSLNRYVAVKILRKKLAANAEFIGNFSREARAAATVSHPNLAQVYSFGEHNGQYYLAMELLERGSLDDRIVRLIKLPEKDVLEVGIQVAAGLRAAYQRDLLHRDIKPGNILFNDEGIPKIVDFGLARARAEKPGAGGEPPAGDSGDAIWGTPYYIAPEKLRGHPEDFRSDIYSLGATLFHALAGRPPFDAATAGEVVTKHATQPLLSLKTFAPQVHDQTARVIARMMAKNPAERYSSYEQLTQDLNAALDVLKTEASTKAIVAPTGERIPVASIIGTVAGLIVCAVVIWFVWAHRASLFHESAPPAGAPPGLPPRPPAAGVATGTDDGQLVDFTKDSPWLKAWNVATIQLAQSNYQDALMGYENALRLPAVPGKARQWTCYFLGLTLMADNRPGEAGAWFTKCIDPRFLEPNAKPDVPNPVTLENSVGTLSLAMVGALPLEDLEAAMPRLPDWARALAELNIGLKRLEAGDFAAAGERLRHYGKLAPDPQQPWAYLLRPLADKLAGTCDASLKLLTDINALDQQGQFEKALDALHTATQQSRLVGLKAKLLALEPPLKQKLEEQRQKITAAQAEEERRKHEQEELAKRLVDEEVRKVQGLEAEVQGFYRSYDFKRALAPYEGLAAKLQTADSRAALEQRRGQVRLLAAFKSQLAADFARQPYTGQLAKRDGSRTEGKLARATDDSLIFAIPYGELPIRWTDLSPETLAKLAAFYANAFKTIDQPPVQGRRCLMLAVFAKQYGLPNAAAYAQQAVRLAPELQTEVDLYFGKEAGEKPADANAVR